VAVGNSGTIASSTNGVEWLLHPLAANQAQPSLLGIAFGSGHFVAVGQSCNSQGCFATIVSSSNGVNWVQQQLTLTYGLSGIAYGRGNWVAVGPDIIVTSPDGANWVQRRSGDALEESWLIGVGYGNGNFVAVGYPGTILQSGDFIVMSIKASGPNGQPSVFLEGTTGLNYMIQSSTDLVTWHDVTTITNTQSATTILDGLPVAPRQMFYRAYAH